MLVFPKSYFIKIRSKIILIFFLGFSFFPLSYSYALPISTKRNQPKTKSFLPDQVQSSLPCYSFSFQINLSAIAEMVNFLFWRDLLTLKKMGEGGNLFHTLVFLKLYFLESDFSPDFLWILILLQVTFFLKISLKLIKLFKRYENFRLHF